MKINNYKIVPGNEHEIIIYLDPSLEEFGEELGTRAKFTYIPNFIQIYYQNSLILTDKIDILLLFS
ncbi:hypothetical protein [Pallidibacillus pasinlerensis]|uniref:Uncharacterized protein n=1 Tax=Pallidibacillus pasinlerensis TaxID=2703818 RepID=A0ABX0A5F4_9BACI|nr:hypothetical protein [Pallidibacillus pasinlerensis]NCU18611.1 hypothetical protein [Pallidibacillus pasinlerensis]